MNIKEFAKSIFDTFFIIFTCAILGWYIYLSILGYEFAPLREVIVIFALCIIGSFAGFILYSKKEMRRHELLLRHFIHLLAIMGIALSAATYMGWVLWNVPFTVIRFSGLIMGIYIAVMAIEFYKSKRLMDKMNEKLKERYKE